MSGSDRYQRSLVPIERKKMTIRSNDLAEQYIGADTMGAIGITNYPKIGEVAEALQMLQVATPRPKKDQVAVKLAASSIHIDEIYATQGTALGRFYGPKKVSGKTPYILGSSVSGTVVAVGSAVTGFQVGDEVIAIPSEHMEFASWATYRCIGEKWLMPKPVLLSHVDAAAVTMASCVAWGSIKFAKVKRGDHCVVVGASGAIGVLVLQFLKSLGCHVIAVCSGASGAFVREYGADEVIDYTKHEFGEVLANDEHYCDAVFDCVGGRDIETNAFKCLKKSGTFETVVGPRRYIGEEKLSWPAFLQVMWHIIWRMGITRLKGGPKYTFGEKYPRLVIDDAMDRLLKYDIRMPVPKTVPFEIEAVAEAVRAVMTHREKGRTVIDFDKKD